MSGMYEIITSYIDGLKTSIDRLNLDTEGNEYAKGYRTALDDIGGYVQEVEDGLFNKRSES